MDGVEMGLDMFESSDESDFDPSQSFDLFDEINSANASVNKRRCYDHVGAGMEGVEAEISARRSIPPGRRPGTHNLLTALSTIDETIIGMKTEVEKEKTSTAVSSPLRSSTGEGDLLKSCDNEEKRQLEELSSEEEDEGYEDEAKQLMITTARAKACSSYIQMRQKMVERAPSTSTVTTRAPLFGSLDEFGQHLLTSDYAASGDKSGSGSQNASQ